MMTNSCTENFLDKFASIIAIPDEAIDFYYPLSDKKKVIDASFFIADYQRTFPIITKKKSIRVSEGVGASLAADVYEVKIEWIVEAISHEDSQTAIAQFERLENNLNHLLLKTIDDHRFLLRVHEGAWKFSYVDKDGHYECSFTAQSASGLQRIPMN